LAHHAPLRSKANGISTIDLDGHRDPSSSAASLDEEALPLISKADIISMAFTESPCQLVAAQYPKSMIPAQQTAKRRAATVAHNRWQQHDYHLKKIDVEQLPLKYPQPIAAQ
jgi:hypothetical protein